GVRRTKKVEEESPPIRLCQGRRPGALGEPHVRLLPGSRLVVSALALRQPEVRARLAAVTRRRAANGGANRPYPAPDGLASFLGNVKVTELFLLEVQLFVLRPRLRLGLPIGHFVS